MTAEEINNNQIPQDASKMTHKQVQQLVRMAREAGIDLGDARQTRALREKWAANQARSTGSELQKTDYMS